MVLEGSAKGPLLIGLGLVVFGLLLFLASGFGFRKFQTFRKEQWDAIKEEALRLVLGEGVVLVLVLENEKSDPLPALVPNDGNVAEVPAGHPCHGETAEPLTVKMREGLMLVKELRGMEGSEVVLCMKDVYDCKVRLYPVMSSNLKRALFFFQLGCCFMIASAIGLGITYPPGEFAKSFYSELAITGAVVFIPGVLFVLWFYAAYTKGRRQRDSP